MTGDELPLWIAFTAFIAVLLALDLGLFHRRSKVLSTREALAWFGVWMGLALLFNAGIILFHARGSEAGLEFFTGFLVEKSLSIDNVFVFILIFSYFRIPPAYQHKVLFWGIVGAIVLRIAFILGGLALLERFRWTIYVFGAFLLFTGCMMLRKREEAYDPGRNWVLRLFRRAFPVTERLEQNRFFVQRDGRWLATPLFVVLLAIESSDIVFAVDSIPAIFAITPDPFIVYTSNIFAMLGLRSLYFAVGGFMRMFHALHYGFASIIILLGVKMLLSDYWHLPIALSLVLIVFTLMTCIIVSLLRPRAVDLKPLFERTERLGLIPFRRLLLIENILDLGQLAVRDAMRQRSGVRVLRVDEPWEENLRLIRATNYSRYPLVDCAGGKPSGILHIKDVPFSEPASRMTPARLRRLARRPLEMAEDFPLDEALSRFQRRSQHLALVLDARGEWTGILTIEDVLEEIVGRIGDEHDLDRVEQGLSLADALAPGRVVLDLRANSLPEAIRELVRRIPRGALPLEREAIIAAAQQREEAMETYLGDGLAVPHARLEGLEVPVLAFARAPEGIALRAGAERADLIFLLLTPVGAARIQARLLADIVALIESEYVAERLRGATSPAEIIEAIRAGQQVAID